MKKISMNVTGMDCASCAVTVQTALSKVDGVVRASVNPATAKATVEYDETKVKPHHLHQAVMATGYGIDDGSMQHGDHDDMEDHSRHATPVRGFDVIVAGILTLPGLAMMLGFPVPLQ